MAFTEFLSNRPTPGLPVLIIATMTLCSFGGGVPHVPASKRRARAKFVYPRCNLKARATPGACFVSGDFGLRMARDFGGAA